MACFSPNQVYDDRQKHAIYRKCICLHMIDDACQPYLPISTRTARELTDMIRNTSRIMHVIIEIRTNRPLQMG